MEQLVILLLIALISFINWLVKKSSQLREERKREKGAATSGESLRSEPSPAQPEAEPEISMRRLREALGLPEEVEPPALPRRTEQRVPPPLPAPPPPLPTRPVASHVSTAPVLEHYRSIELPTRFAKPGAAKVEAARGTSRVRELLGSSGGLRDAVVLSEILGPPRCLRATQR
ncbi:MAG TPA: hypothetical protein VIS96_08055 [Terrimicrobiaceae bacterium]